MSSKRCKKKVSPEKGVRSLSRKQRNRCQTKQVSEKQASGTFPPAFRASSLVSVREQEKGVRHLCREEKGVSREEKSVRHLCRDSPQEKVSGTFLKGLIPAIKKDGQGERVDVGGMVVHALSRASARAPLFEGPADYHQFEDVLSEARLRTGPCGSSLTAPCRNHWHLVSWPERDGDLARRPTPGAGTRHGASIRAPAD